MCVVAELNHMTTGWAYFHTFTKSNMICFVEVPTLFDIGRIIQKKKETVRVVHSVAVQLYCAPHFDQLYE